MSAGAKITVYSVLCLIWGSTWLMIKVGLGDAPPLTTAGLRFLLAALVILVILLQQRIALPRSRAFFLLASYLGIFHMAVPYGLVYWAEQHLTAGLTAVVFATMPLMVTVLARLFLGDPLSPWKTAGILMGAVGVYVIFSDSVSLGGRESVYGVLAVLASAFFAGLSSIVAKKYSTDYPPFATILLPHLYGGIILCLVGTLAEKPSPLAWSTVTYTSIIYLAILGSVVAFALYFWIIKHIDVTVLSYQTFIIPVVACLLGWIFLRETVTLATAMGGILVLGGIVLAVIPQSHRKRIAGAGP